MDKWEGANQENGLISLFLVKVAKRAQKSFVKMPPHYQKKIKELVETLSNMLFLQNYTMCKDCMV